MGPNQTHSFSRAKETINKMKSQLTMVEIFANDATERV